MSASIASITWALAELKTIIPNTLKVTTINEAFLIAFYSILFVASGPKLALTDSATADWPNDQCFATVFEATFNLEAEPAGQLPARPWARRRCFFWSVG